MICDFCLNAYFRDYDWDGNWRHHHVSAESWVRSIGDSCSLCLVLEEDLRSFLERTANARAKRVIDRSQVPEGRLKQDRLTKETIQLNVTSWPLYQAMVRKNAGNEWGLMLRTRFPDSNVGIDEKTKKLREELPQRNFTIYKPDDDVTSQSGGILDSTTIALEDDMESEASFAQISKWINDCKENHHHCKIPNAKQSFQTDQTPSSAKTPFVPTRLLDVGQSGDPELRLVITDNKLAGPYTTLSHRWGDPKIWPLKFKLQNHNIDQLQDSISLSELPRTFKEAVIVTRRLKIKYLWIDSLCIIQESDMKDWSHQSTLMAQVYGSSYCNLAAVDSFDGRGGLFRSRTSALLGPSVVHADSMLIPRGNYRIVRNDFWDGELLSQLIYRRAWVFQERMLSPRILHFGHDQIFWQCLDLIACESAPTGLPSAIDDLPDEETKWRRALHQDKLTKKVNPRQASMLHLDEIWKAAVYSYSTCNLTNPKDKIVAISGIAKEMQKARQNQIYLAGLWGANLHEQLGWHVEGASKADGNSAERAQNYRAPSWSWPCIDGVIRLANVSILRRTYHVNIEKVDIRLDDEKRPFGQVVKGCSLHVHGQLLEMQFSDSRGESNDAVLESGELIWHARGKSQESVGCRGYLDCIADAAGNASGRPGEAGSYDVLLLAYTHNAPPMTPEGYTGHGLLLQPDAEEMGHFRRVGCMKFTSLNDEAWAMFQECHLTSAEIAGSMEYEPDQGHKIVLL